MPKSRRTKEQKKRSKHRTEQLKASEAKKRREFSKMLEQMSNQATQQQAGAVSTEELNIDTGDFAIE